MQAQQLNYDLRKLLKPYANKWVVLSRDHRRVLANGNTLKEVASKSKTKDGVFMKVFPTDSLYLPHGI